MNKFIFPRFIKREDAQKVICGWCGICENPTLEDLEKCDDICPQFSQIPNGDVRPVVRGEWHKRLNACYSPFDGSSEWIYFCNVCRHMQDSETPFCPNCGAVMRGGEGNG